jgi:hypothetical protein
MSRYSERAPVVAREEWNRNTVDVIPTNGGICLSRFPSSEPIKQIPRRPSGFVGMTGHILFSKVPCRAKDESTIGMTNLTTYDNKTSLKNTHT